MIFLRNSILALVAFIILLSSFTPWSHAGDEDSSQFGSAQDQSITSLTLQELPTEILANIFLDLISTSVDDAFSLAVTCKRMNDVYRNKTVTRALLNESQKKIEDVLRKAIEEGHVDLVEQFLNYLVPGSSNLDLNDLLGESIRTGNPQIAQLLMAQGAKISEIQIFYIHQNPSLKCVLSLLNQGLGLEAFPALKGKTGRTILFEEYLYDYPDLARVLIRNGADVNALDATGKTPLFYTTSLEIAHILIKAGADVNVKDLQGTPLLHQVVNNLIRYTTRVDRAIFLKHIKMLLRHKADVNASDKNKDTLLHLYSYDSLCELLIKNKADLNSRNREGKTPLHKHLQEGKMEIAKLLIDSRADVNAQDEKGMAALDFCKAFESKGLKEMACFLLDKKADVHLQDKKGRTFFQRYRMKDDSQSSELLEVVRCYLSPREKARIGDKRIQRRVVSKILSQFLNATEALMGAVRQELPDEVSETLFLEVYRGCAQAKWNLSQANLALFYYVVKKGDLKRLEALSQNGVPCQADRPLPEAFHDRSLLHLAVRQGAPSEIIRFLIENKADIEAKDSRRRTPFFLAVENKNLGLARSLFSLGAQIDAVEGLFCLSPLMQAVKAGDVDTVEFLLENKADVEKNTPQGTALCLALQAFDHPVSQFRIIQLLLSAKADVNRENYHGLTPLWSLLMVRERPKNFDEKALSVVEFLVDRGAQVENIDPDGNSLLHKAVMKSCPKVAEFIIRKYQKIDWKNNEEKTPWDLVLARDSFDKKVIQLLLENKADVHQVNPETHETILQRVIHYSHLYILEVLVKNGADVNQVYPTNIGFLGGKTALYSVIGFKVLKHVQILVENGADVTQANQEGLANRDLPLYGAVEVDSPEIVEYLVNAEIRAKGHIPREKLWTAWKKAKKKKNLRIMKILEKAIDDLEPQEQKVEQEVEQEEKLESPEASSESERQESDTVFVFDHEQN